MRLLVWSAVAVLVVSGCASQAPEEAEPSESPSPAAVESPSASPSVEVDPRSAQSICDTLRLRDVYVNADNLEPHEEAQIVILGMEANTAALEEDAEPALREIALEHMGDTDAAVELMVPWCQENTEPLLESDPW
ncbi:hypothetical protein ACOQFV_08990 [Nocardiopsis changdeensis]|uniref:hypothetical protein n=1 Tax=Nocardiopsis TaxID=2013 RepID=UPI002102B0F0|nr:MULTISPECIES: hypothetical protein [Nocardiopsis]